MNFKVDWTLVTSIVIAVVLLGLVAKFLKFPR